VATSAIQADTCIAQLISFNAAAAWPLASKTWWPSPRVMGAPAASAKWTCSTCPSCRHTVSTLSATRNIAAGEEITVPSAQHITGAGDSGPAVQVSFDGGTKDGSSGAAAVLWLREGRDQWLKAATATLPLPKENSSQVAEAWGLKLAIYLLIHSGASPKWGRTIGDCLSVVRYGASQGLLRKPEVQSVLEPSLHQLAAAGWVLEWIAVHGRHNSCAHELATQARKDAKALAEAGTGEQAPTIVWTRVSA
jgi:hypothetical protein